ncbi:metal-sensitive transcriptional regulator [Deinococcus sp. SM5_A1]|uniref:metal-sensitive transcriptional regulator n=1 Tax=Deinococcus sp. SM5_A1 TaxID=3379094 RepID=UPI00385FD0DF
MPPQSQTDRKVLKRPRRIKGQVRGLQRMIDEGRDCHDILAHLSQETDGVVSLSAQIRWTLAGAATTGPRSFR